MATTSEPSDVGDAQAKLAVLKAQTEAARAELAAVLADLAEAQRQLGAHYVNQLLEANEQLVVDAMRSRDIAESTAERVAELTRSSELDALTHLPNRLLLIDRFSQGLTHARRYEGRLALLFVDLDGFKLINDTVGHQAGDEVLRDVSRRLVGCVRQIDTVCRLGGDEFLVLLPEIADAADPGLVAAKLLDSLAQISAAGAQAVKVSASVGIAVYPDDADGIERLVDCADQAMYRSKRAGGGRYSFFSSPEDGPAPS